MEYKYIVRPRAFQKIRSFYVNVARKYQHAYSYEDMERDIHNAFFSIYQIEQALSRRKPTLTRWEGYHKT